MKEIVAIGKPIKEKVYFLLYLGKILSQQGKTLLITKAKELKQDIDPFEYSKNLYISNTKAIHNMKYQYIINDTQKIIKFNEEKDLYLITNSEKEVISENKQLLQEIYNKNKVRMPVEIIYMNLYYDSKINEKYLTNYFQNVLHEKEIMNKYKIPFDYLDAITTLENEYDNKLILKTLSKNYKKVLYKVASQTLDIPDKQLKKVVKQAERSKC